MKKGSHHSEEAKGKIGKASRERIRSEIWCERISISHKGLHHSEEAKKKMSRNMKGIPKSEEHKRKLSEAREGMNHSEEAKRKIGKAREGKHHSKKTKEKMARSAKRIWQNPEHREKQLKAIFASWDLKPNKLENKLKRGLNKLFPGEYKYVGDGYTFIGGKNPDFININGQKKIIELFGDYWHGEKRTKRTKYHEEQRRIRHFIKYGYKTLIIWEKEFQDMFKLKEKIKVFHNGWYESIQSTV